MFKSKVFTAWYFTALAVLLLLFAAVNSIPFLIQHWYYPVMMVGGAFVAGFTPEGGGAVAFPVLSVFLHVDRVLARDFSMMIQSVGMTSASIFILSHKDTKIRDYEPCLLFVPVCTVGTLLGFLFLQTIPVYIIQAMFLSLSVTFVISYYFSEHRGTEETVRINSRLDLVYLGLVLILGGMVSSLFGTGADVLLYLLLVTHFNMPAKKATRISIILQAAISILGFAYRGLIEHQLTTYQVNTWLCAAPVALFMAPLGVYILQRLHVNIMLKAIIALNVFQICWFNFKEPSPQKLLASAICCGMLGAIFYLMLRHMEKRGQSQKARELEARPA